MITDTTKKKIALFMKEVFGTGGSGKTNLGTGGGTTNPQADSLDVPIQAIGSGSTNSTSVSDDKVIEVKASFTGSSLQGYTIREMGIFGSVPKDDQFDEVLNTNNTSNPEFTTETVMLTRINFESIGNFSTGDTIEVIYTMEVE